MYDETMQFESLKVFCDVARYRSFSQAAAANHVSRTHPGVLSQLNYGNIRESAQTWSADYGRGFVAVKAKTDGQVA